jgi:hypothetical protein
MTWLPAVLVASGPNDAPLLVNVSGLPIAPGGVATIDGVSWNSLIPGATRVLLLNQGTSWGGTGTSNGIWIYQGPGAAMARPTTPGDYVHGLSLGIETVARVAQGTALAHSEWVCITQNPVVDTTAMAIQPTNNVRSTSLSLSTGVNVDIPVGFSNVISLTTAGAFSIAGLAGGWEGREVTLLNPTGYGMTIKHQDTTDETVAANRILCQSGADTYLPAPSGGFSWCKLKYCTLLPGGTSAWLAMDYSPPQPLPWQFLSQLVLSLRSDTDVTAPGGTVTAWTDQSGAGNSVVAGPSGGPAYNMTGGPNGYPTLSGFSPTAYLDSSTSLVASGADRTVLFVGQATTTGGDYFTFARGGGSVSCFTYLNLGGGYYCWTDAIAVNMLFPASSFHAATPVIIVAVYHQGSLLTMRVNGKPITVSPSGGNLTAETGTPGFSVGVSEAFSSPGWDGYIVEQHVCATQFTLAQCEQFEAYASARYGITI